MTRRSVRPGRLLTVLLAGMLTVQLTGLVSAPLAAPTPAAAADPPPSPTGGSGAVVAALQHTDVRAYWTAERMRQARPLDLDPSGAVLPAAASTSTTGRSVARAGEGLRSTGKLFFTDGRADYVCSAAAINTPERDLVVTAGHCVNPGGTPVLFGCRAGTYFSSFLFVPGYDHNARPYGTWVGTAAIAQSEWVNRCDDPVARDQALIRVAPVGGFNLVDVVGGNALAWNYPVREDGVRVVGWPAQAPYDGQSRQECVGSTFATQFPETPTDAQMSCPLTGGASGGPWFVRMAGADTGFIFAVTSRRTTSGPSILLATPFDSSIEGLLALAGTGVARPVAGRRVPESAERPPRRQRLRLAASTPWVGYGEAYQLVARTRRVRRIVLQVRTVPGGSWHRIAKARVRGRVTVFTQAPSPGTLAYRVKVRGGSRRSAPVTVTVGPCPVPLDRSPDVVSATRCTSPVG
ncbi:hypothetical protein FHP29_11770 [Nocardioides albidus]|uniref:Trypsin-like peptidase domain-containing protein n=1 Tax=Nocardioides albidus TaxID=1517589 RepID=A0A5C4VUD5_9ACTN|nr:hypothetical protein [Nocardioides albidus]TNM39554.1 hypothetical protein FHP29_11770 [Nocardioides albidus]